jgi:hypothetical protein
MNGSGRHPEEARLELHARNESRVAHLDQVASGVEANDVGPGIDKRVSIKGAV